MVAADLTSLRQQIDQIDQELLDLLNKRAVIAIAIGNLKNGESVYRPEREAEVLANVKQASAGPLPEPGVALIFHVIMAVCHDLQLKSDNH